MEFDYFKNCRKKIEFNSSPPPYWICVVCTGKFNPALTISPTPHCALRQDLSTRTFMLNELNRCLPKPCHYTLYGILCTMLEVTREIGIYHPKPKPKPKLCTVNNVVSDIDFLLVMTMYDQVTRWMCYPAGWAWRPARCASLCHAFSTAGIVSWAQAAFSMIQG